MAAGNYALLQLLGNRKIANMATFCHLSPAPVIGTSDFHGRYSHIRHKEFHQVQWTFIYFCQIGSSVNGCGVFQNGATFNSYSLPRAQQ